MAQATQMTSGLPLGEYSVIDNAPAANYAGSGNVKGTITAGAPGYDNSIGCTLPGTAGTLSQATNPYQNGTIPDFLNNGKSFTSTAVVPPLIISYKFPS